MEQTAISVYSFVNYRTYFKTVYEELKFQDSHFSYRTIQKLAGFSHNSNHFWQILEGRRPVSQAAATKYGKVFGLRTRELKYLKLMVEFDLAKNDAQKNKLLDSMKRFRMFATSHSKSLQTYDMFADWHLPILWDMVAIKGFQDNGKWIAQHSFYNITPAAAEKGLKKLLDLGLLVRKNGKLTKTTESITTDSTINPIIQTAHRNYMRESITMSVEGLNQLPLDQRLFIASTLLMSKEQALAVRDQLLNLMLTINDKSDKSGNDKLYQLNLQYFSLLDLGCDDS